jgi:hypothetical protein
LAPAATQGAGNWVASAADLAGAANAPPPSISSAVAIVAATARRRNGMEINSSSVEAKIARAPCLFWGVIQSPERATQVGGSWRGETPSLVAFPIRESRPENRIGSNLPETLWRDLGGKKSKKYRSTVQAVVVADRRPA